MDGDSVRAVNTADVSKERFETDLLKVLIGGYLSRLGDRQLLLQAIVALNPRNFSMSINGESYVWYKGPSGVYALARLV